MDRPGAWALSALLLAGCGDGHGHDPGEHAVDEAGGHAHAAPHGGLLIELGAEEFAHVELLLEPEERALTAWILDGAAERAVRSAQPSLDVELTCGGRDLRLSLLPVASALTGETVGDTSEFRATDERLGGCTELEGRILRVEARGSVFEDVALEAAH